MAYSYIQVIGDGVTSVYTLALSGPAPGYIYESHISVSYDAVLQDQADRVFVTSQQVQLLNVPASGTLIKIFRESSILEPVVDFEGGAALSERNLDLNTTQMLLLSQEAFDATGGTTEELDLAVAQAEAAALSAGNSANAANTYANAPIDQEIGPGLFSGLHYVTKTQEIADGVAATAGDMTKIVYDTNASGVVDSAETAVTSAALTGTQATAITASTTHAAVVTGNPHAVDADDVNCLALDNTTVYTPTADYHPATKKLVDDAVISAGAGDMTKAVYDTNNDGTVDSADTAAALTGTQATSITNSATHVAAVTGNPHAVTKTEVGLSNVTNNAQVWASTVELALTNDPLKVPASSAVVAAIAAGGGGGLFTDNSTSISPVSNTGIKLYDTGSGPNGHLHNDDPFNAWTVDLAQNYDGIRGVIGTYPIAEEYFGRVGVSDPVCSAVVGAISIPSTSVLSSHAIGISGYSRTYTSGTIALGCFGQGETKAAGASSAARIQAWGVNGVATDNNMANAVIYGAEFDVNAVNPATWVFGVNVAGESTSTPGISRGFDVNLLGGNFGGTKVPWAHAFYSRDNAANIGIHLGTLTTGVSQGSQPVEFKSRDAGGVDRLNQVVSDPGGNLLLRSGDSGDVYFAGFPNAGSYMYYDGAVKANTTATGFDVTGALTVNGAPISGGGLTNIVDYASGVSVTGNIILTGLVDGYDIAAVGASNNANTNAISTLNGYVNQSVQIGSHPSFGNLTVTNTMHAGGYGPVNAGTNAVTCQEVYNSGTYHGTAGTHNGAFMAVRSAASVVSFDFSGGYIRIYVDSTLWASFPSGTYTVN